MIHLFESFEADKINKMIHPLKVAGINTQYLISDMKVAVEKLDIPLHNIPNDAVFYKRKKEALTDFRSEDTEESNIKWLKFWFSIEDGYKGYTKTTNSANAKRYISNMTYDKFQEGPVEATLHRDNSGSNRVKGYLIYCDWNEAWYLLHNDPAYNGSGPTGATWDKWRRNLEEDYRYSWGTNQTNNRRGYDGNWSDMYSEKIDDSEIVSESEEDIINSDNRQAYYKHHSVRANEDVIKVSDYAMILDIEKIITSIKQRGLELSPMKQKRENIKKDTLAFKTDQEVRNENMNRYLSALISKYGITDEGIKDLTLEGMAIKVYGPTFFRWSHREPRRIRDILNRIATLPNKADFDHLLDRYEVTNEQYKHRLKEHQKIMSSLRDNEKEFINVVNQISGDIKAMIKRSKIDTIQKWNVLANKMDMILDILTSSDNPLSEGDRTLMKYLHSHGDYNYIRSNYSPRYDMKAIQELRELIQYII